MPLIAPQVLLCSRGFGMLILFGWHGQPWRTDGAIVVTSWKTLNFCAIFICDLNAFTLLGELLFICCVQVNLLYKDGACT